MSALSRLIEADRLVTKGLAQLDGIMSRHWMAQAEAMRADGVPEDQIEAAKDIFDKQHAANRVATAKELWLTSLAALSAEIGK